MSVSASIDIMLVNKNKIAVSPVMVIKQLINYGWTLNDNGYTTYLPLDDDDNYNWTQESIGEESLMAIISQKELKREVVGLAMTWEHTGIGGAFLARIDGSVSVNLTINRKCIELSENKFTDVNWYLHKLLFAFDNTEFSIETFSFEEHV